ncbi:MAG: HTH domain-containing protein [Clostridia bacterium]|nr:HTH domain-containing protein [Clostridia bacterium]
MTRKALADSIGVTMRTIDRCISSLKKKGILARQGSNKGGTWDLDCFG